MQSLQTLQSVHGAQRSFKHAARLQRYASLAAVRCYEPVKDGAGCQAGSPTTRSCQNCRGAALRPTPARAAQSPVRGTPTCRARAPVGAPASSARLSATLAPGGTSAAAPLACASGCRSSCTRSCSARTARATSARRQAAWCGCAAASTADRPASASHACRVPGAARLVAYSKTRSRALLNPVSRD